MRKWIVTINGQCSEYIGDIPEYSLHLYGLDWIIVNAISEIDAVKQSERYFDGVHPAQADINTSARAIRVLADESTEKAIDYIKRLFPVLKTNIAPKVPETVVLELEAIGLETGKRIKEMEGLLGERGYKPRRPWVAEITGLHPRFKFNRSFVNSHVDYSKANNSGDRGVYFVYHLHKDKIYEVRELISWKHDRRYFCRVQDKEIIEIEEEEVMKWLNTDLE